MADDATDFAVVVYRDDDRWEADALPRTVGGDLDELVEAARRQSGGGGAIGFVSIEDDFFVAVRIHGRDVSLLLSDITAAGESPLAGEVLEALDLPLPGPEDERVQPAGDLTIFSDLGLPAMELGALCDDLDLYPDQMLDSIASRLGFADAFRRAVDSALAD
ncbi:MAG TPA: tRNA adenosine deaminase-associated protein [Sporichthyaceae bacterium]|jgi:putative tRNA adenosine deaminase-associated protein